MTVHRHPSESWDRLQHPVRPISRDPSFRWDDGVGEAGELTLAATSPFVSSEVEKHLARATRGSTSLDTNGVTHEKGHIQ